MCWGNVLVLTLLVWSISSRVRSGLVWSWLSPFTRTCSAKTFVCGGQGSEASLLFSALTSWHVREKNWEGNVPGSFVIICHQNNFQYYSSASTCNIQVVLWNLKLIKIINKSVFFLFHKFKLYCKNIFRSVKYVVFQILD